MSDQRVLIVDDEPQYREVPANFIRSAFPHVVITTASDGAEALELVKTNKFDLILTDIKMPKMEGDKFIEEMRKLKIYTPVLVISGHMTDDLNVMLFLNDASISGTDAANITQTLSKPYRKQDLLKHVKRLLELALRTDEV